MALRTAYFVLLTFFFTLFMASTAQANLIRYDVSFDSSPSVNFGNIGYLVFDVAPGATGNIWANLVDWRFEIDTLTIDPSNTTPLAVSEFNVDALGSVISDGTGFPRAPFTNPCFSSDACLNVATSTPEVPYIFFTRELFPAISALRFAQEPTQQFNLFFGTLRYSAPNDITPVPVQSPLVMICMGLALLSLSRRQLKI